MSDVKRPYRTTYEQMCKLISRVSTPPEVTISELKGARYQAWLLAKELGLLERRGRAIGLTGSGKKFLDSDMDTRRRILRVRLGQVESFSSIWSRITSKDSGNDRELPKSDIAQIVSELTDAKPGSLLDQYTANILNLAANANLIERKSGRTGVYNVYRSEKFGDIASEPATVEKKEVIRDVSHPDLLDRISLLVYDVIHRDSEKDKHIAEIRQLVINWGQAPWAGDISDVEKRIVLNELNHALSVGTRDSFRMVAETLAILRGERSKQRNLSDF